MPTDFFIRCDGKYVRIDLQEIQYLESLKNYVRIVTHSRSHLVLISLRQLENELPPELFVRVHRSYLVSLSHIRAFDHDTVFIANKTIPISPVYRPALTSRVKVLQSETRLRMNSKPAPGNDIADNSAPGAASILL